MSLPHRSSRVWISARGLPIVWSGGAADHSENLTATLSPTKLLKKIRRKREAFSKKICTIIIVCSKFALQFAISRNVRKIWRKSMNQSKVLPIYFLICLFNKLLLVFISVIINMHPDRQHIKTKKMSILECFINCFLATGVEPCT